MLCEWCRRPVRWWQSRRRAWGGQFPVMHLRCALMAERAQARDWDTALAKMVEDGRGLL